MPGKNTAKWENEARAFAYDAKYDRLVRQYGSDPIKFLFETMMDEGQERSDRLKAASELVRMRYPAKKAVEVQGQVDNTITLRDLRKPVEKVIEGEVVEDWDT